MMKKLTMALIGAGLLVASVGASAAVSADEAKKLGTTLTLFGAEKAGNKEGTIPEYTGGVTTPPAGFDKAKGIRPDPFANEKPLFSIDAKNMAQYGDKLTEGTKALMKTHAGYRADVYPTHRSVAYPKWVLDNTVKNATRTKTSEDRLSMHDFVAGIPFPIPKNGNEVMLNNAARYQGQTYETPRFTAYNIDANGKMVLSTQGLWVWDSPYYGSKSADSPVLNRGRSIYSGPARRVGEAVIVVEPTDWTANNRKAWSYLPGQRRVRLAPDLSYDTPNPTTSGMSTFDDANLYNGNLDRYDVKLVGKKELYVPYNGYKFTYHDKAEDLFQPKFINPDWVRWELHRVWVVELTLKEGKRHVYSRRTFYVDEDSWVVVASDQYDGRGQLWRPGFAYLTPAYDVPAPYGVSGHYDLIAGTYYIHLWPGSNGVKYSDALKPDSYWTADALAAQGVR